MAVSPSLLGSPMPNSARTLVAPLFGAFFVPAGLSKNSLLCCRIRPPTSNNSILPLDKALGFIQGLLCGAQKLTQVAYLRHDPVVPEIIGIKRIASQSVLSRFFAGFDTAGKNQRCFGDASA